MNDPKFTGRNIREHLLLDYCRACSTALRTPTQARPFEAVRLADEIVRRVAAGEEVEIFDAGLKRRVIAELALGAYIEADGNPNLDFRFNRDAQALLTSTSLTAAERKMVLAMCSPLSPFWWLKVGNESELIELKPRPFSRKPIDPKKLETIDFTVVPDEDTPSD
jgi:hypothetical protein